MTGGTSLRDKSASVSASDKLERLDPSEKQVLLWKMKRLVQQLRDARGNGTSMISLVLSPRDQIGRVASMLTDEYGTASNIKSRVNKLSVLSAITSAQQRLKLYSSTPLNGLVLYVGTVLHDDGKEKKITVDMEPFRPIRTSLYLCDSRFHTEPLEALLTSDDPKYGLVVVDGKSACYFVFRGNARETLHRFTVDLPKKHGKGGQSAQRFARIRDEKRHNYVRKVAEAANHLFLKDDSPNIDGLVLAGFADFKTELVESDIFDPRLRAVVLSVVDVAYGGENGANQALRLAAPALSNVRFVRERRLLSSFFESLGKDDGLCSVGAVETMACLECGAVSTLLVWEALGLRAAYVEDTGELLRWEHPDGRGGIRKGENEQDGNDDDIRSVRWATLLEWLIDHGRFKYGCDLELVTDCTQEGSQFCKGFGGLGALLRYQNPASTVSYDEDDGVQSQSHIHHGGDEDEDDFFV